MAGSATTLPAHAVKRPNKSVYLVLGCTIFAAAAQVLMKFGANHKMPAMSLADGSTWMPFLVALLGNVPLLSGYCMSAGTAFLFILGLRDGELSMLYPIIALTYVWVTLLSYGLLHERPNWLKNVGITTIMVGVAVLGRGGRK